MKNRDKKRQFERVRALWPRRKKYLLSELIVQRDGQPFSFSQEDRDWLNMPSVGREIIER